MKPDQNHARIGYLIFGICLLLVTGCSGELPSAPLLTPPALRTEIAAQTQQAGSQELPAVVEATATPTTESQSDTGEALVESPLPAVTEPPLQEATLTPTEGPTPTKTVWWRRTPTITPTPTPPAAGMYISRPGTFSKVKSPLLINASTSPGADGMVWVELIGEDGRSLYQTRLNFASYTGRSIGIAPEIEFEILAPAELARLVLSTRDDYGRINALTSTDLILIQMGDDIIYPSGYEREPYILRAPFESQVISGGVVQVNALVRPVNDNPLILELLDEQGTVIGSTSLELIYPTGDLSHTPFDVAISYTVSQATHARLVLRQESTGRIPGTVALSSIELTLEP